jgi:hypothetical protein
VGARPEIYHEALVKMGHELVTIQKQVHTTILVINNSDIASSALYHLRAALSLCSRRSVQAVAGQARELQGAARRPSAGSSAIRKGELSF